MIRARSREMIANVFLAGYVFGYYAQTYFEGMGQTKEDIGAYMSWIPLVGGSLSVVVGGLIADYVVRKYGPVARLFVIVVSLVRIFVFSEEIN